MSRTRSRLFAGSLAVVLGAAGAVALASPAPAAALNLTQYVNPFIGTDDSNSPNPVGGGAGGSTYPGATVPFGMVQFSPDTPTASPSGYRYSDRTIEEFSLTHFNGAGCPNNEDLRCCRSPARSAPRRAAAGPSYASAYTKSNGVAAPGYYKNRLDKYGTAVELTATTRTGALRLTYPATTTRPAADQRQPQRHRQTAPARSRSAAPRSPAASPRAGSAARRRPTRSTSDPVRPRPERVRHLERRHGLGRLGTASGTQHRRLRHLRHHRQPGRCNATVGISFVSVANAQANLTAESRCAFDTVRANADAAWNSDAQPGPGHRRRRRRPAEVLHRALPRAAEPERRQRRQRPVPRLRQRGAQRRPSPIYQNYSGWDIYRSWAALVALIAPDDGPTSSSRWCSTASRAACCPSGRSRPTRTS